MSGMIESPCIEVCQINEEAGICHGCFRTLDEIAKWERITPAERRRIMKNLALRKGRFTPGHASLNDH